MGTATESAKATLLENNLLVLCRGLGKDLFFFLLPAVGLSFLLMQITESALWMPHEWRYWVLGLGVSAGLACFRHAAGFRDRFALVPKEMLGMKSKAREAAFLEQTSAISNRRDVAAWRRASVWFFALVGLVGLQVVVLNRQVHPWKPSYTVISNMFLLQAGRDALKVEVAPDNIYEGPCYLERKRDNNGAFLEGSFLFPLFFCNSQEAKSLAASIEATVGPRESSSTRQFLIDNAPLALKELIISDLGAELGLTKFLFVVVHLLIMVCASFAYGLTFTWKNELYVWFADLF